MSGRCPPAVLHIPHASVIIPDEVRPSLVLSDLELEHELLVMTDWYTWELFALDEYSTRSIMFPVSRLVVDPERFVDDEREEMAKVGMGVVYTKTSRGRQLRKTVTPEERAALIQKYYEPHHERLTSAVGEALDTHGHCMIIDCHSFPTLPQPYELDQRRDRPDICIGTDEYHTSEGLSGLAVEAFEEAGLRVELNRPFSGTIVPLAYYGKSEYVLSIMVEIRRGLYMDEVTGERLPEFERVMGMVRRVIRGIAGRS